MGAETVWARREGVLGTGRQEWSVPLVVYPEAVVVAEAMAVYERQRRWGREFGNGAPGWVSRRWISFVGERLGMSAPMEYGGYRALREWTLLHGVDEPVVARLGREAPPPDYLSQRLPVLQPMWAGSGRAVGGRFLPCLAAGAPGFRPGVGGAAWQGLGFWVAHQDAQEFLRVRAALVLSVHWAWYQSMGRTATGLIWPGERPILNSQLGASVISVRSGVCVA